VDSVWTFHPRNFSLALTKGEKPTELDFTIGPVSLGRHTNALVIFRNEEITMRPEILVDFPHKRAGEGAIQVRKKLDFC
jgi:hypothetical protein